MPLRSRPAVTSSAVESGPNWLVGTPSGSVAALDFGDGRALWSTDVLEGVDSTQLSGLAVSGDVAVVAYGNTAVGLSLSSGEDGRARLAHFAYSQIGRWGVDADLVEDEGGSLSLSSGRSW